MPSFSLGSRRLLTVYCATFTLFGIAMAHAAMDPRFELDTQALEGAKPSGKHSSKNERRSGRRTKRTDTSEERGTTYTIRQGDHLFRILMRDYGLSNDEAESFIDEIRRVNNIYDIKKLRVGQKITIPPIRRRADGSLKVTRTPREYVAEGASSAPRQALHLEAPAASAEQEVVGQIKETWDKLVPAKGSVQKPLTLQSPNFSLTLDPQRYPVFVAQDGAKILVDQGATIPPLVRSLIAEKDPTVRIVAEAPGDSHRLLGAILNAGGFYSVEENFSMDFGADPKLTVRADYKVEKTSESVIKQDVVLLSSSSAPLPPALQGFLKKEGFTLLEPFATSKPFMTRTPLRQVQQITAKGQSEIADAILKALAVPFNVDRRVDVFAADNNGISLSVKADRYFERNGKRFVVSRFDGDPVTYTLFRILETKGYGVVILEGHDDFRRVAEKILSRLHIGGSFAHHMLVGDHGSYSLQMSGFNVQDPDLPSGSVFLTNRELDRIIKDLLVENGYQINQK